MSDLRLVPVISSTPLEFALDENSNRLLDVPHNIIRIVKDPWRTPAEFLPFLAWERGVDLWYDDWSEHRKRSIIADIYRLKRLKGTLPGAKAYLSYVDGTVVEPILPPQGFLLEGDDADASGRWKAGFAQLRLHPYSLDGARDGGFVLTESGWADECVIGVEDIIPEDTMLYFGRRAVLWDDGVEIELRSRDQFVVDEETGATLPTRAFLVPGEGVGGDVTFSSAAIDMTVLSDDDRGRMIVLGVSALGSPVVPQSGSSVDVLSLTPERVAETHPGTDQDAVIDGTIADIGSLVISGGDAGRFFYDRYYLYDPARSDLGGARTSDFGSFIGQTVIELDPYRAHLRIDTTFDDASDSFVVGANAIGHSDIGRTSDRMERIARAVYVSAVLRDLVLISTRTYRPREIGDLSFSGSVKFDSDDMIRMF